MATSYIVLKRLDAHDHGDAWEEVGSFEGNPDAIVRKLAAEHGGGVYWPIPARTRAINASVVTPEPIIKLSDFAEDALSTATNSTAASASAADTLLLDPEPAPV